MAIISSRKGLIDYCLRRLGEPVIEVNVDPDQIEDRVDDTLSMYQEFHSDGTFRNYYSHTLTAAEVEAQCITIPESILYVVKMYSAGSANAWAGNPIAMPMMGGTWIRNWSGISGCSAGIISIWYEFMPMTRNIITGNTGTSFSSTRKRGTYVLWAFPFMILNNWTFFSIHTRWITLYFHIIFTTTSAGLRKDRTISIPCRQNSGSGISA